MAQEGFKRGQGRPKDAQEGSKMAQEGPELAQEGFKMAQEGPKGGPRRSKGDPRRHKKRPKDNIRNHLNAAEADRTVFARVGEGHVHDVLVFT